MDAARFVFLDETGTAPKMGHRYGRSSVRQASGRGCAPGTLEDDHLHRRAQAERHCRAAGARWGHDRSGVSRLRRAVPGAGARAGDVVVLDNMAAHEVDAVRQAIVAAGASILYLPPHNPDLNPIEQLFANLTALVRKAAARTRDELWQAIGLLATVWSRECANSLKPLRLWLHLR